MGWKWKWREKIREEYSKVALNYLLIYLHTYLLTPWCTVLLEKLNGLQLVKKFPAFHGTRRFIIALTNVRHLSLSWASPIRSIYPHPTSWRSILILSTHLRLGLPSVSFPTVSPANLNQPYLLPYSMVQSPYWEANWSRNSPPFTEPVGSLPHSQTSANCLYPGPAQSSPYTHIPPPGDPS